MKNISTIIILLLCTSVNAQINLQYSYPNTVHALSMVRFSYSGDKYVSEDPNTDEINIYSLNFTLEKTITIPSALSGSSMFYVSDALFDLDSSIEYLVSHYSGIGTIYDIFIVKEDGSILLEVDSAGMSGANPNFTSDFENVYPSVDGTKLILFKKDFGYLIYSIPGTLPCYECTNGVYTGNVVASGSGENLNGPSNPFPNPTNDLTRIDYRLPDGIKQGELVFYNTSGVEVKRFKVTNAFHFIYVSAKDLPSGTYYFTLQTSSGVRGGKKLVVVR